MNTADEYTAWDVPKINMLSARDIHSQETRHPEHGLVFHSPMERGESS